MKGKKFLYHGYSVEGKQHQVYLGEATGALLSQVEGWKANKRDLQRLTAMAMHGRCADAIRSKEAIRTRDADMVTPRRIAIAAKPDIDGIITQMGYTPVPSLNHKHPPTSYTLRGKQAKIDLLTPQVGKAASGPVRFPPLGIAAQPLSFLISS